MTLPASSTPDPHHQDDTDTTGSPLTREPPPPWTYLFYPDDTSMTSSIPCGWGEHLHHDDTTSSDRDTTDTTLRMTVTNVNGLPTDPRLTHLHRWQTGLQLSIPKSRMEHGHQLRVLTVLEADHNLSTHSVTQRFGTDQYGSHPSRSALALLHTRRAQATQHYEE